MFEALVSLFLPIHSRVFIVDNFFLHGLVFLLALAFAGAGEGGSGHFLLGLFGLVGSEMGVHESVEEEIVEAAKEAAALVVGISGLVVALSGVVVA